MSQTLYQEPREFAAKIQHSHHRYRIVVPCFDKEQAERISDQLANFASHSVEKIVAVSSESENLGEVVVGRRRVDCNARGVSA